MPVKQRSMDRKISWVPIRDMSVSEFCQRRFKQAWADHLATVMDLDRIGLPVLSYRDGIYWIVDGQHRIEALRILGFGDEKLQCEVFHGLTPEQEADLFLDKNNARPVAQEDKFRVGVNAGRDEESDIDRIVRLQGLTIGFGPDNVSCTGTLKSAYELVGPGPFGSVIRVIRDAYGVAGMQAPVIMGLAFVLQRYAGNLPDEGIVSKSLGAMPGGVNGLINKAGVLQKATGANKKHCTAAAIVEQLNRTLPRGRKLPTWWKEER